ncbi:MAG: quinoprotein relay system zinc metallohydrolase 2 [Rhodocyclaceae bacterium]|nr:quinoprotein relay system zinc metallohydrolase 2 [Rhodocyclaceae bacterium]
MLSRIAGFSAAWLLAAVAVQGWGAQAPFAVDEVAPGVFVHQGRIADLAEENGGDIANIGFVVGERCVAVIDTGSTRRIGEALLAALRARTELPVCYVINTHMHLDHVFGNAAFEGEAGVAFVAAARMPASLSARAEGYLRTLDHEVGEAAEGTRAVYPTMLVEAEASLDLGGRTLTLRAWPTAHTDNDLTVFDERTRTLWTGDLLFERFVPIVDGSIRGWLDVIERLAKLPAARMVPGHGAIHLPGGAALAAERGYLAGVANTVRKAIGRGDSLRQVLDAEEGSAPAEWALAERFHARNLSAAYTELEWED